LRAARPATGWFVLSFHFVKKYSLMKLIDMYFWQIGFERSTSDLELAQVLLLNN
jgi:hypothetical protein